ncbi:hypothetical protein [Microbacterium sp. C7(2022)]|uniref:hypothetical protein n=1 Tax=Microbacterium sp. C7(2022) TaxID=2992759 RepID=UPI00237A1367|nr:hypothetical protein [Microbacterium sp. C7(2022)]MDE0547101.1 hypothetical protein [Microbacterium sp. C7(2022)]
MPQQAERAEIAQLRAQLERVQGRKIDAPVLPVHPALSDLLPGGGLRPGAVYSVSGAMSLLLGLIAGPSQEGSWCGMVGMPEVGIEAAERLGVDLGRVVLVPRPGIRWIAVAATLAEVLPVVAVRPLSRAGNADASRLMARLRDRNGVLLVQGPWPQAEATLDVAGASWEGLGRGHGYLSGRSLTVTSSSRRWPTPRRRRLLLPAGDGSVAQINEPLTAAWGARDEIGDTRAGGEPPRIRAVG